jgi:hypothetical protein
MMKGMEWLLLVSILIGIVAVTLNILGVDNYAEATPTKTSINLKESLDTGFLTCFKTDTIRFFKHKEYLEIIYFDCRGFWVSREIPWTQRT